MQFQPKKYKKSIANEQIHQQAIKFAWTNETLNIIQNRISDS